MGVDRKGKRQGEEMKRGGEKKKTGEGIGSMRASRGKDGEDYTHLFGNIHPVSFTFSLSLTGLRSLRIVTFSYASRFND